MKRIDKFPKTNLRPKVSVLIPARNEARNIENCLNSLLYQDYNDLEIIVLNDNSVDQTQEILNKIQSEKIKIIQGKTTS